jgi:hypothetical protein
MANPTISDVLDAIHKLNGDVRVALDRTENHSDALVALTTKVDAHGLDMAKAKGQASVLGVMGSVFVVGLVEAAKALFAQPHH